MRISDWSSDVCSSDLVPGFRAYSLSIGTELMIKKINIHAHLILPQVMGKAGAAGPEIIWHDDGRASLRIGSRFTKLVSVASRVDEELIGKRSEEHTSELQSLMRNSYAVFCLKKNI